MNRPKHISRNEVLKFYDNVIRLSARVDFLEEMISEHALRCSSNGIHPHNKDLLDKCRISITEATGIVIEADKRIALQSRVSYRDALIN